MKKKIIPFILLPLLIGCSEDNYYNSFSGQQGVTLSATLEQQSDDASVTAKTAISSDSKVVWSTGDKISVLSSGKNDEFTLKAGEATTSGTFSGDLSTATQYYALYPYSTSASYDGTSNISFTIPQEQTYAENSFGIGANPAVAAFTSAADELKFKNLCGVLTLKLTGVGTLTKIEVTGKNSEYLWGTYTLTADDKIGTDDQTLTYASDGGKTVTLNCGTGVALSTEAKEFDIVLPAITFTQGFDIRCYFAGASKMLSSSNSQAIARSKKHVMAEKDATPTFATLDNPVAKQYLDYVATHPYSDNDWDASSPTSTYITNYYQIETTYRKDRPYPATITWTQNGTPTNQYLTVSLNSDFSEPYYDKVEIGSSATSYDIYDLIPNRTYYYKVTAKVGENTETFVSSDFNTLGHRRMLYIDGVANVRDLGGIPTADGHTIKYGKIFRGGRPNNNNSTTAVVTDAGRQAIKRAGVKVEMDLRHDAESGNLTTSPFNTTDYTVEYCRYDALDGDYGHINDNPAGAVNIQELQKIIDCLKEENTKPVYFHCSVGADRTGTLAFMIEGLLGVGQSNLSVDYELTSFSSEPGLRSRPLLKEYYIKPLWDAINTVSAEEIAGVSYPPTVTTTLQRKFYHYYYNGINGSKISQDDLNWFINYMLEYPNTYQWGNGNTNEYQETTPDWKSGEASGNTQDYQSGDTSGWNW